MAVPADPALLRRSATCEKKATELQSAETSRGSDVFAIPAATVNNNNQKNKSLPRWTS